EIDPFAGRCCFKLKIPPRLRWIRREKDLANIAIPQPQGFFIRVWMIRDNQWFVLFPKETHVQRFIRPAKSSFRVTRGIRRLARPVMLYLNGLTLFPNLIVEVVWVDRLVNMTGDYDRLGHLKAPIQSLNNLSGSSLVSTRAVVDFFPNFCNK